MLAPGGSSVPISFTGCKSTTRVSQITTIDNLDNMAMFAFSAGRGGNTGKKSNNDSSSSGGGGDGWFGGGCGSWYAKTRGSGGGGGSSHISSKLFTNSVYKAGNEEFLAPDGVTMETGHSGAGMVRITLLEVP